MHIINIWLPGNCGRPSRSFIFHSIYFHHGRYIQRPRFWWWIDRSIKVLLELGIYYGDIFLNFLMRYPQVDAHSGNWAGKCMRGTSQKLCTCGRIYKLAKTSPPRFSHDLQASQSRLIYVKCMSFAGNGCRACTASETAWSWNLTKWERKRQGFMQGTRRLIGSNDSLLRVLHLMFLPQ